MAAHLLGPVLRTQRMCLLVEFERHALSRSRFALWRLLRQERAVLTLDASLEEISAFNAWIDAQNLTFLAA